MQKKALLNVKTDLLKATVHISAGNRYRLYMSDEWLGDGLARSFSHLQQFDSYDVQPFLVPGKNVIAVTINHCGEETF